MEFVLAVDIESDVKPCRKLEAFPPNKGLSVSAKLSSSSRTVSPSSLLAEKNRRAELGSARLDGRDPNTASLDKQLKTLRAAVADLEANESAAEVLAGRIETAKRKESEARVAVNEMAQVVIGDRTAKAHGELQAALASFRAALLKLCALENARGVFGANVSTTWAYYALSPIQLTSEAANPRAFEGLSAPQLDAARAQVITELRTA
jgi:hypothetical protein